MSGDFRSRGSPPPQKKKSKFGGPKPQHELFSFFSPLILEKQFGESTIFIQSWLEWANKGLILSIRQAYAPERRIRHDKSKPKTTKFYIKTKQVGPYKGHLPIPAKWTVNKTRKISAEVSENTYTEVGSHYIHRSYVTYERQDLRYIQNMITAGIYIVEDIETVIKDGKIISANIYIKGDGETENFCIKLDPKDFLKQDASLVANVDALTKVFQRRIDRADLADSGLIARVSELLNCSLWQDNLDSTVKILRCNRVPRPSTINVQRIKTVWHVIDEPHIACDESGIPIKGDMDQRNCIVSYDLPLPLALELIDVLSKDNLSRKLIIQLQKLKIAITKDNNNTYLLPIIDNAIAYLKKHNNDETVAMLGNIELINAAIVLGSEVEIEHGSDGVSILLPENYAVEHIPSPDGTRIYETYGEFDYLAFILMHEEIFVDKLVNFNPCEFTKTKWVDPITGKHKMREDRTIAEYDRDKVLRVFNNYQDEDASIALRCLLYERQLLQLRAHNVTKFTGYLRAEISNGALMLKRARKEGKQDLVEALGAGVATKMGIIRKVARLSDDAVNARLDEIHALVERQMEQSSFNLGSPKSASSGSRPGSPTLESRPASPGSDSGSTRGLAKQESFKNLKQALREDFTSRLKESVMQMKHADLRANS